VNPPAPDAPLARTPRIEALLRTLRGRILGLMLVHGLGTLLAAVSVWLVFAYFADWVLRVPKPVRIFHGLVLCAVAGYFVWREFVRPLRRLPGRTGLALLTERANPELRELLVSAVQFQTPRDGRAPDGDPELVERVLVEAEAAAARVDLAPVLDPETPRARLVLGALGTAGIVTFACLRPTEVDIFVDHLLGGDRAWPRRTLLLVEIPPIEGATVVESTAERVHLRVARGTDVPVKIRAEGVAPEDVLLSLQGREDVPLARGGGSLYRTLLRSLQEDVVFWATGGDDQDEVPRIEIDVLQPPDVQGLAIEVRPPAYTRTPPAIVFSGEAEVLRGSELVIHALPVPPDARGRIRFLPEDTLAELKSAPFPIDPEQGDGVAPRAGLSYALTAEASFGYRIELVDAAGLSNPDPGLHRVLVNEDRTPEVEIAAPNRTEVEVVPGGALPLRVSARDDLGLVSLAWSIRDAEAADEAVPLLSGALPVPPESGPDGAPRPPRAVIGAERIEVAALGSGGAPVAVDRGFVLEVVARDEHEPAANQGHAAPVRLRVVSHETLLRRLQDRLGRARMDAIALSELQREKRARALDLAAALETDGKSGAEAQARTALLNGQRRVLNDAEALLVALSETTEEVLYARIDDKANGLLLAHDERMRAVDTRDFPVAAWRQLVGSTAGERGGGLALSLVRMVGLALAIGEDDARAAVAALEEVERAAERGAALEALERAEQAQARALAHVEDLLEELKAWDNFQNVLSLVRDVLARQKNLRERTQRFASHK
jgi:hypothetical protein